MKNKINDGEELYFTPKGVLAVIITTATDFKDEPKATKKCKAIIQEISKLMAIRGYGKPAKKIYEEIMNIQDADGHRDFTNEIYNKYIFADDIDFLLHNTEVM